MSDWAEGSADVYDETTRKAARDHVCCACHRVIHKGAYYCDLRVIFDGRVDRYKRCGACQKTHEHLRELCDGEDMWPREDLSCGLDYADEWGGEPPEDIARLPLLTDEEAGRLLAKDREG